MAPSTCFTDPAAVVAWDSRFRWRTPDGQLDRTIDATWWRVANAITGSSNEMRLYAHRYVDAFSQWRLLPDERLLRFAGTGRGMGTGLTPSASPRATLNVARFVVPSRMAPSRAARVHFDVDGFRDTAALAVRMLDDVLMTVPSGKAMQFDLRIGLMGFGDALAVLGLDYTDAAAIAFAHLVGATLARGTLQGTVEVARERGPLALDLSARETLWRGRGMPEALMAQAVRDGVRHCRLTAIESQPCLALFANNSSDALEPSRDPSSARATPVGQRGSGTTTVAARLAVRRAMQGWIDAPIDYPLPTVDELQLQGCRGTVGPGLHPPTRLSR